MFAETNWVPFESDWTWGCTPEAQLTPPKEQSDHGRREGLIQVKVLSNGSNMDMKFWVLLFLFVSLLLLHLKICKYRHEQWLLCVVFVLKGTVLLGVVMVSLKCVGWCNGLWKSWVFQLRSNMKSKLWKEKRYLKLIWNCDSFPEFKNRFSCMELLLQRYCQCAWLV